MVDFADAAFTKACQDASGPEANPRLKLIIDSLMAHLHAFVRDVDLQTSEWLLACDALVRAGQVSDSARNEMILLSDILGIETLVDSLAQERAKKQASKRSEYPDPQASSVGVTPTASAIIGPFYREGAPKLPKGADVVQDHSITDHEGRPGPTSYVFGVVRDSLTGDPIREATLDVWHAAPNGCYDQQDLHQPSFNNRGTFSSSPDGTFAFHSLRSPAYPIPRDSVTGELLKGLDRPGMRPAHVHLMVRKQGYEDLVTQIFDSECPYIEEDAVFATKQELVVDYSRSDPDNKQHDADWELQYDLSLVPLS